MSSIRPMARSSGCSTARPPHCSRTPESDRCPAGSIADRTPAMVARAVSTAPSGSRTMSGMGFISRHAIGVLVVLVIAVWALFYVPTTPSYAIYQLKQAIDARDGATAATFVDFPSVVKNAGY